MKLQNISILFWVLILSVFTACEPIEDSDELMNNATLEEVELIATQSTEGGNLITLKMNTPGVTGHWDYNLGKAFTDEVQFVYPIPGTATFTFNGTLGSEFFTKTIDVQIDVLDNPLDQDWYDLVSTNTSTGKQWVFDGTPGNGQFWYMSVPDDPNSWNGLWWNAGDCCLGDPNAIMQFDLNGGANYTYYSDSGANPVLGSFNLDVTNQTLSFVDAPIAGDGDRGSPNDTYHIISLTETEMILYIPRTIAGDSGWTWVFKAL